MRLHCSRARRWLLPVPALAVLALLSMVSSSAASPNVAVRGLEAAQMRGDIRVVLDATAPDGVAVVVPTGEARAEVDLLPTRAIELTVAGGCDRRSVLQVRVDGRTRFAVQAGTRSWHGVLRSIRLVAGVQDIVIRTGYAKGDRRACAAPRLDRLDFLPVHSRDGVLLGAAMRATAIESDPTYRSGFLRNFDSMTPENELEMANVEPHQGQFTFGPADELIDVAHAADKLVRGHALVYGSQLPRWVVSPLLPWTPARLLTVMRTYITTVMDRYRGEVSTWDVVNEAISSDGTYTRNVWYDVIGPSYIADAFRFAHAADPAAELFYNDLGGEEPGLHADAIIAMIEGLQASGVPIDGIGLEDHIMLPVAPTQKELEGMMRRYAELGLRIEITELDVGTAEEPGTAAEKESAQTRAYRAQATACWDVAACQRLTTWGEYDGLSWIGSRQMPLMFSTAYRPKPAFFAVETALHRPVPPGE